MTDNGTLDAVLNNFTNAISGSWGPNLSAYLLPLLMALVVVQFGLIAVEAAIARDVPLLLMHILLGIIRVGIVVAIFEHAFEWGNDIVQTGQTLGQNISGFHLTPSGVFNSGVSVMQTIFNAKAGGSWYMEPFEKLEFFIVGLFVMLCWAAASIVYLGALIEAALLVYVGPLIIAFTPLSWTFEMLLVWGRSLLGIAFKVALVLMTLAIGITLATGWTSGLNATTFTTNIWNLLITVVEAILFAWCVWKLPNQISGLTAGAAIVGFGESLVSMAGDGASRGANMFRGGGGGGAHGGGQSGAMISREGWAGQAATAAANAGKVLAQKVQAALTR
jgi:P-type conjugative transfer protein TrbL